MLLDFFFYELYYDERIHEHQVAVHVNVTVYLLAVLWLSNNVNLPFVLYGCDHLS